jgi:hypothetical protein
LYKSKLYQEAWLTLLGLQTADPASMDEELGKPVIFLHHFSFISVFPRIIPKFMVLLKEGLA